MEANPEKCGKKPKRWRCSCCLARCLSAFRIVYSCFENCQLAFGFLVFLALNFLIQTVVFLDLFVVAQK